MAAAKWIERATNATASGDEGFLFPNLLMRNTHLEKVVPFSCRNINGAAATLFSDPSIFFFFFWRQVARTFLVGVIRSRRLSFRQTEPRCS